MTATAFRECAILLTHRWSPALARHVERLKRETAGVLDVYLVLQAEPGATPPPGMAPDLTITAEDTRGRFPLRTAELETRGWQRGWASYVDLVWISAFLHEKLAAYDRFWLIEYDVDLKGDWGRFFTAAACYEGDLLVTRLRRLSSEPDWKHTSTLKFPPGITDPLIGLFPLSRLSRPLVEAYARTIASPEWGGHFEALLPTLAESSGFAVTEISGEGPWTPPERTNLHYAGGWGESSSLRTTFSFRPPHAYRYFADRRFAAGDRDILYHPVKVGPPLRKRLRALEQDLRYTLRRR